MVKGAPSLSCIQAVQSGAVQPSQHSLARCSRPPGCGQNNGHEPACLPEKVDPSLRQPSELHVVQVEAHYFSAAAGHARITLGNRRWGENGYVASGRQRARPVQNDKPKGPTPSKVSGL